jgi:hypothetical protein
MECKAFATTPHERLTGNSHFGFLRTPMCDKVGDLNENPFERGRKKYIY